MLLYFVFVFSRYVITSILTTISTRATRNNPNPPATAPMAAGMSTVMLLIYNKAHTIRLHANAIIHVTPTDNRPIIKKHISKISKHNVSCDILKSLSKKCLS